MYPVTVEAHAGLLGEIAPVLIRTSGPNSLSGELQA
jgi:hypothetical protein